MDSNHKQNPKGRPPMELIELIQRGTARDWKRREARKAKAQADSEAVRGDRSTERSAMDVLLSKPSGQAVLTWAESEYGLSAAAINYAFRLYHQTRVSRPANPFHFLGLCLPMRAVYDNKGRERGHGEFAGYEPDSSITEREYCELLIDHVLSHASDEAVKRAAAPATKAPRHRSTKVEMVRMRDALRKRQARAEGRIPPRPKKAPRTTAQMIEATQKALATREAKLAQLQATPPSREREFALAKAEESLRRTRATLQTYQQRLAHP